MKPYIDNVQIDCFPHNISLIVATYYFAAITGLDILIEDDSALGIACQHIHCGFPFRSEYFPDDYVGSDNRPVEFDEENILTYFLGEVDTSSADCIILDGFNGGERCWSEFDPSGDCVKKLSNCYDTDPDRYASCVNGYAISQQFPGPMKILEDDSDPELLVGFDKSSELFHAPFQQLTKPPLIDIAIHVRMEFNVFESMSKENTSLYASEVSDWMASGHHKKLLSALTSQVISVINSNSKINSHSDQRIYTVYIAADNAEVKNNLFNHIQRVVSQAIIDLKVPLTLNIMMLNVSNLVHVRRHNITPLDSRNKFALIFDWYALATANSLLAWSKNKGRGSTYRNTLDYMKKYSELHGSEQ